VKRRVDGPIACLRRNSSLTIIAGLTVSLVAHGHQAQAGNLINFIGDLYGGQGVTLADSPPPIPTHAHHFTADAIQKLDSLSNSVASGLNLTSFTPTTAVGIVYNIELGLPVTTTESLGTIISERAETLGQGKLNLAATYSRANYTTFNGQPLSDLTVLLDHGPVAGCSSPQQTVPFNCDFEKDKIRLDINTELSQDVVAFYGTYGITSDWDATFVLPVVHTHAVATSDATIIFNSTTGMSVHSFVGAPTSPHSVSGGDATGIGDIVVHSKYNFLRGDPSWPDLAVSGIVKVPSGDKNNLLGTGSTDLVGLAVLSKQMDWVAPHLNLGYQQAFGGLDRSAFLYAVGADFTSADRTLTPVLDFVGRVYSGNQQLHDMGLGMKWNPFGSSVFSINFLIPVNKDNGLRPNFVASVGYQLTFW
jgi:hypothetical protein